MKIDPRHLVQLSVIVETGSYQSAADSIGITQPALSRNMKALEERIGAPLFERMGRRSVSTVLGQRLARYGLAVRAAEEQAENFASLATKGYAGKLRIGATPILAGRYLSQALSKFITEFPECSVELKTGLVPELRNLLERGQIDAFIGPQSLERPSDGLQFTPLIDDCLQVVCRLNHPLLSRPKITASDLASQRWIAHSLGSNIRQQTESALMASGIDRLNIGCETDSIRTAIEIAEGTDLLTTLPRVSTAPYIDGKLKPLQFEHPNFRRMIGIVQHKGIPSIPITQAFLSRLALHPSGLS